MKKLILAVIIFLSIFNAWALDQIESLNLGPQTCTRPRYPEPTKHEDYKKLEDVPHYLWSFGCFPTAAAMLIAYYQNHGGDWSYLYPQRNYYTTETWNCNYTFGHYGGDQSLWYNNISATCQLNQVYYSDYGNVGDYWVGVDDYTTDPYSLAGRTEHSPDCIADYANTSIKNRGNADGATTISCNSGGLKKYYYDLVSIGDQQVDANGDPLPVTLGPVGLADFLTNYCSGASLDEVFSQRRAGYAGDLAGFTFMEYKAFIDEGKPILFDVIETNVTNPRHHTIIGIGYLWDSDVSGSEQVIYLDTWCCVEHAMSWNGTSSNSCINGNATYTFEIKSAQVVTLYGTVGIEDYVLITNPTSQTVSMNPGATQSVTAQFYDEDSPPVDNIANWSYSFELLHSAGAYSVSSGSVSSTSSTYTRSFTAPTSAQLTALGYSWSRDTNGYIKGRIKITGTDSDGVSHEAERTVSLSYLPEKPLVYDNCQYGSNVILTVRANGATSLKLYYGTTSGGPYNGTGATNGPSPFTVSSDNTINIGNLTPNVTYYFKIKGINGAGESVYSDQFTYKPVTASGTLAVNETWNCNVYLLSNLTVPSGKTLTIASNKQAKLCNSSVLTVNSGGTLTISSGAKIKGETLSSISPAVTGNSINVNGTLVINGNVEFLTDGNKKWDGLKITNHTNALTFSNTKFTNCSLNLVNTQSTITGATFTNSNLTTTEKSINLTNSAFIQSPITATRLSTTGSATATVSNCNINTSTLTGKNGVYILGYNIANVSSNVIEAKQYGIYLKEVSSSTVSNNTIQNSMIGVCLYHSTANITGSNIVKNNQRGIYALNSSVWSLVGNQSTPLQTINDNTLEEVKFNYDSVPFNACYNKIYDIDELTTSVFVSVANMSATNIDFKNNYWGPGATPDVSRIPVSANFSPINGFLYSPVWNPGVITMASNSQVKDLFLQALSMETDAKTNNYDEAEALYKSIISNYPDSYFSSLAAAQLLRVYEKNNQDYENLCNYYLTQQNNELADYSFYLSNYTKLKSDQYQSAIEGFEEILDNPPTLADSVYSAINIGYSYLMMQNNTGKFDYDGRYFSLKPSSMEKYLLMENDLLSLLTNDKSDNDPDHGNNPNDLCPSMVLNNNFPNPFNPSTTISFSIPTDAKVELEIFNIKGQKVRTLTKEVMTKGNHNVIWNGDNNSNQPVSSGIYFYKLTSGNQTITKKMIMIK